MFEIARASITVGLIIGATASMATEVNDQQLAAARRVMDGQEKTYVNLKRCEAVFLGADLDPRYIKQFWDSRRFEIFEGVRMTLRASLDSSPERANQLHSEESAVIPEKCVDFLRNDVPGRVAIDGVAMQDLKIMAEVYQSTRPDPHVKRDRSLFNDCVKANFNSRQRNFDIAINRCECVNIAMKSVPQDDLDGWLARAHSAESRPMQQQPWFGALAPKLQACYEQ